MQRRKLLHIAVGFSWEITEKNGVDPYFPSGHSDSCLVSYSMVLLKLCYLKEMCLKTSLGSAGNKERHKLAVLVLSSGVLAILSLSLPFLDHRLVGAGDFSR